MAGAKRPGGRKPEKYEAPAGNIGRFIDPTDVCRHGADDGAAGSKLFGWDRKCLDFCSDAALDYDSHSVYQPALFPEWVQVSISSGAQYGFPGCDWIGRFARLRDFCHVPNGLRVRPWGYGVGA